MKRASHWIAAVAATALLHASASWATDGQAPPGSAVASQPQSGDGLPWKAAVEVAQACGAGGSRTRKLQCGDCAPGYMPAVAFTTCTESLDTSGTVCAKSCQPQCACMPLAPQKESR